MMKCGLTLFVILILTAVYVQGLSAQDLSAYIDKPRTEPTHIRLGDTAVFEGYVSAGLPPYIYSWIFCPGCNPDLSNLQDPGTVSFPGPGKYTVSFTVTDNKTSIVSYSTVYVDLANITYPQNNTFWGINESIPFRGQGLSANPGSFSYLWDFGDLTVNADFAAQRTIAEPIGVKYRSKGGYNVSLTVTDAITGASQKKYLAINTVEPVGLEFECTIRESSCAPAELELLRMFSTKNSQVRSYNDTYKAFYPYPLCCIAPSLYPSRTGNQNAPAVYAALETDLDALGVLPTAPGGGGSHISDIPGPTFAYYELTSKEGAAPECQSILIGTSGKCSDINMECLYEFFPGPERSERSHMSNCTAETEPNSFGNETWAMCCTITEDCTNNVDDNNNIWFDCVDANACTIPGNERPCGTSNEFLHDPTCIWMQSECNNESICDFSNYSTPYYDAPHNTYGFKLPSTDYPDCIIYQQNGSWIAETCPAGTNETDIIIPQSARDALEQINLVYAPLQTTAEELFFRCRYYYCSAGEEPTKTPLPTYVEDMNANSEQARHCCQTGYYWDPSAEAGTNLETGETIYGACTEFFTCYNPKSPASTPCQYDFTTEFAMWVNDVSGATNPVFEPEDCVRDDLLHAGIEEKTLCCPAWLHGENTYGMQDITYFMMP